MDLFQKYWHNITIPFVFFTVWLWSFPMYGPLLSMSGKEANNIFMIFLLSHAIGLLSYGLIIDYYKKENYLTQQSELIIILIFSSLIAVATTIFPYLPSSFLKPLIFLIGLFSGPLVVFYLYYLSLTKLASYRGRILSFIFFLAGLIAIVFLVIPSAKWMYFLNGLFLLGPFYLIKKIIAQEHKQVKIRIDNNISKAYWISLIFLLVMFYIGGGLMYNLLYASIMSSGLFFDLGFLFSPIVVFPAGILADLKGRRMLINLGLCFSGMGFLLLFFPSLNSFSLILLQSGFAVMDLFVFLTLMDWADYFTSVKVIATGLFLNVLVIFISGLPFLENSISSYLPREFWPAFSLALILLLIPLINSIKETFLIRQSEDVLENKVKQFDNLCEEYSITPREKEVISLLLEGKDTGKITDLLSISYNTLKTHLRNIYRKTTTGSQTELILFIWNNTKNL